MTSLFVSTLLILGAAYGKADVTNQVRGMVQGDGLQIQASNDVFGDTWPTIRKTLVVVYQFNGDSPRVALVGEGEMLTIGVVMPVVAMEPVYDAPPAEYIPPPPPPVFILAPPPPSPVGFWGHHPVPGGGWCFAEGPHLHPYEPEFFDQYALIDGFFRFGEGFHEWFYAGPHPIAGGGWCGIMEPHRHPYRPEVGFIWDPVRRGFYYDRERAVVIRTEVVHAPPNYRPPSVVLEHQHHPPERRLAPPGTPPQHVWEREHVIEAPHPAPVRQEHIQTVAAHPAEAHPAGHPGEHAEAHQPAHAEHAEAHQPARAEHAEAHAAPAAHPAEKAEPHAFAPAKPAAAKPAPAGKAKPPPPAPKKKPGQK